MIGAEHFDAAATRIREYEVLGGYPAGDPAWLEYLAERAGVDPLALQERALELSGTGLGPEAIRCLLTGVVARQLAEAEGVAV